MAERVEMKKKKSSSSELSKSVSHSTTLPHSLQERKEKLHPVLLLLLANSPRDVLQEVSPDPYADRAGLRQGRPGPGERVAKCLARCYRQRRGGRGEEEQDREQQFKNALVESAMATDEKE